MRHRAAAGWLIALALLIRLIVPAGYMPALSGGSITIMACTGYGPAKTKMAMAMPGMADHGEPKDHHRGNDMPCGYGGLAAPTLGGADPLLLAAAFLFIVAAVFRAALRALPAAPAQLRPPPRGPPASA